MLTHYRNVREVLALLKNYLSVRGDSRAKIAGITLKADDPNTYVALSLILAIYKPCEIVAAALQSPKVYQWKLLHHVFKDHLVMLNPVHLSLQVHRLYGHIRICIQTGRPELEFTPLMRDPKCATFVTEEICEQLRRRAAAEDSDSGVEVEVSDAKDGAAGGAPSASGGSALSKLNEETHAYCRGAAPPAGDRPETQAVHG
ncbi:hypothetical protein FJT64_011135 [Amphibalanus amphitrite]|uniref:Uncharacterized protein n=1 Tax=Amphibalanus amphitrite TaxID=1232801 RepID=A0A6A4VAM3_AMPAM|nr:hypothetical protein FJT64_011135 [Amphibalanus amphitrite]